MFYTEQQTTGIKIIKENATRPGEVVIAYKAYGVVFFTRDAGANPGCVHLEQHNIQSISIITMKQ